MQYLGIEYQMKHPPKLDPTFIPFGVWREAYLKDAKQPIAIAVERDRGRVSVHDTFIHGTPVMAEADYRYVERYVKFLLWSIGGFKVSVCGCSELAKKLQAAYSPAVSGNSTMALWSSSTRRSSKSSICPWRPAPPPTSSRSPWAAIWTAAASALTPAALTGRYPPLSTASASTPRRSSGSPS